MKAWKLAAVLAFAACGAFAQSPSLNDAFVVLRVASSTNVFHDCDLATGNPDFTNVVGYLYAGENLFLGGEVKTPRYACNTQEAGVDQVTLYYSIDGGPTNALPLPRIVAGSPDQWQEATGTGMVEVGSGWAVGVHTMAVYFVGVDINHCVAPGASGRLPSSGAYRAAVEVRAGAPDVLAADDAAQRAYGGGWTNGANGGYGFGAWTTLVGVVGDGDAAGFFLATNPANPDLNYVASRGRAWGLYANEGGSTNGVEDAQIAAAFRALPGDLAVGQTLVIDLEHGGIRSGSLSENNPPRTGGWAGIGLRSQAPPLQFDPDPISPFGSIQNAQILVGFRGGDANYTVWDNQSPSGRDTGLAYTTNGVRVEVTRTGTDTFLLRLAALGAGGGSVSLTGLTAGGSLGVLGVYNRNAQDNDVFVNRLYVLGPPVTNRSAADDAADSAYSAGWTNLSNGGAGFEEWLLSALPGAGSAGYFLATNPPNTDLNGIGSQDRAWGMYANDQPGGGVQAVTAYRYFSSALQPGQGFGASVEHGGIAALNGSVECMLLVTPTFVNQQGEALQFRFAGGSSVYAGFDGIGGFNTDVPWTDGGLRYDFKLLGGTPLFYALTVETRGANGAVYRMCGEIEAAPIGLRFKVTDVEQNDVFLNRLYIAGTPAGDADGDGMPDDWEQASGLNVSTNDAAGDLDGDGMLNIEEFVAWTQPQGSNSTFRATGFAVGPAAGLSLSSATGRLYTLEMTADLVAGAWSSVVGQVDVPGTGGSLSLTNATGAAGHYRARVRLAP